MVFNTWYNWKRTRGERNTGISMTEPEQVISLHDLITKYSRGADVPMSNRVYSISSEAKNVNESHFSNLTDIAMMSETEKLDIFFENAKNIKSIRTELKARSEKLAAEKAEQVQKELEAKIIKDHEARQALKVS